MSQVRKFAQGGGNPESSSNQTSTKHKPYRITIDGVVQELDDQDLANWARTYSTSTNSQQRTGLNDVINSIKRGNNVTYESLSNTFTGVNWTNQDIIDELNTNRTNPNQKQAERQKRRWARRDYRRGDARQQWMTGMQEAMRYNFNPIQPQQTETTSEDNRIALYGDESSWFDYNTDDKGNVTFSTGPENADYLQRIQNFANFLGLSEEDASNQYSWDGNENYIRGLRAWAKTNNTAENPYDFNALIGRIKSNQLDANDLDLLRYMGFDKDSREGNTDLTQQTVVPRSWKGSGFNDELLEQNNYYVRKDNEGNTYLMTTSTDSQGNVTYIPVTQNIYLRDMDWAANTDWAGGAVVGGKFYTQDQLWNQDNEANRAFQSYVNVANMRDEEGDFLSPEAYRQALLETGWQFAGMNDASPFSQYINPKQTILSGFEYLQNPYYYGDVTSSFNVPEGMHIIGFVDPTKRDRDGRMSVQYAISNNPDQIFRNQEQLQTYLSNLPNPVTPVTGIRNPISTLSSYDIINHNNKRYYIANKKAKVQTHDGNISNADIYRDDLGSYFFRGQNGEFYQIVGKDIMDKIISGQTITEDEFKAGMDSSNIPKVNWLPFLNPWRHVNKEEHYDNHSYDNLLGFKKGGKVPILQYGGLMSYAATNIVKRNPSEDKIGTMHTVGGGPGLTDASDKWATAATALDTASLGASFIPGIGNIGGALYGVGGTAARFVSDIKRDGFDGGDIGRLAVNLGLDALTLLPIAGSAAKAAKIAKAGKTAIKTGKNAEKLTEATKKTEDILSSTDIFGNVGGIKLGKKAQKLGRASEIAIPAIGTISGINATIDAAKDGEITTDEMSSIATGLISGALLGRGISRKLDRTALKALQKKLSVENTIRPITKTINGKSVTLTVEDLTQLNGKTAKQATDFLKQKVESAGIKLEDTDVSKLMETFGIKADKKGIISIFKKDARKVKQSKPAKWDVFDEQALTNSKLFETLQNDNLGYWGNRAARAYRYGLATNPVAHQTVINQFGRSVIPRSNQTFFGIPVTNPFKNNQLQWNVYTPTSTAVSTPVASTNSVAKTSNGFKPLLQLPAWKGSNIPEINILSSSNSTITTPSSQLIQIPQFASSYRNAQGQFLLPRGNGRFFKKTQRVWNGGPAHEVIPIQPIKYSKTPRKSEFRNIGLEQAHKQKVLQETGKQQVPSIRGLQEDMAKVRTSEDFKELLIKINNRGSYKEIIKNNPEIKDQLRQMFVHLDPVRLGNWMTKYDLRFKKGGIIKAQGGLKPGDLVYNNTNTNPYFDYKKAGILFNGSNVDWTKTYDQNGIFNAYRNYYINHWNDQSFNPYKQKYLQQLSQNNNNIDVNNLSLDEFKRITSDQNLGYAHNLYVDQALDDLVLATMTPEGSINGGTLNEITVTPSTVDMSKYMNPTVEDEVIEENIPQYVAPGSKGQRDGLNPSSYTPKVNTFDPQLLFGAAELARSIATNNYMFKKMKEANKLIQKEMPTEIYDRYQDHITPAYQNAAQQKRQFFVPTSTDALTNYAMRQTNEDQARQLELEGNLKASEQYSQWLQNDLAARRAYAQDRRETALFNRQEMLNKLLRDAQIDQGRIAANNQSIANFAMEGRNWFHQNRQRALQAISQYDNAVAQNDYELGMRNAGKDFYDAYMALEDKSPYVDWMDYWQRTNPQHFQENQTRLFKDLQNARLHNRGLDVQWPYRIPTILAKKGGTLKYQQRHTGQKPDEAIWINRNKETAKALEKLHDAVIKLFMKSIS